MADLRQTLERTIGSAYTLEGELGGGGMSRVFLAEEKAHKRRVVIKVLPLELAQGVSVERFKREIQLAAQLQHPHIVPVHTSGETDGLPYYTMPYVEGQSLRARLAAGPLPISETISILREVARALAYAHDRGVVHRDIKPDNILLTGGSAVVTDFGIARAIAAARTETNLASGTVGGNLTALGTAIGTPMYMAPEQAAGDPATDHRADIYAFGCTAYEMLTGRPPFTNTSPQKLLAAHMAETPKQVTELRPDTPPALAALVMQCLAKDTGDRPKSATEVVRALEAVTSSPSQGALPASVFTSVTLPKALAAYAVAFIVVALVARWAVISVGVPEWVFPGAMLLMALGLPMILVTAYVQSTARHAFTATPTLTPGGTQVSTHGPMATLALKASPHVSWNRTRRWGFYAMGAFALAIVLVMISRATGVGPFATLLSAGEVKRGEPVVVGEFSVPAGTDSSLGRVISDAVRADLAQSRAITMLSDEEVSRTLSEMRKPRGERLLLPIAREIAQRRSLKAVVDGSVTSLGAGFVVTLRLVTADSLRDLVTLTGAADSPSQLIDVVGELSRKLRGRFGESLRSVAQSPKLSEATTSSLDALRKYNDGRRALSERGDYATYIRLTQEAIAVDSNFAMAYMRMATELANLNTRPAEMARWAAKAWQFRDRLPDRERAQVGMTYYRLGPAETRNVQLVTAYRDSFRLFSRGTSYEPIAHVYDGVEQSTQGHLDSALTLYRRAFAMDSTYSRALNNVVSSYLRRGDSARADSVIGEFTRRFPEAATTAQLASIRLLHHDPAAAVAIARSAFERARDPYARINITGILGALTEYRGQIGESAEWARRLAEARSEVNTPAVGLLAAASIAKNQLFAYGDTVAALRTIDAALAATPIESFDLLDRPYFEVGSVLADAGQERRAKAYLPGLEKQYPRDDPDNGFKIRSLRARIAMAERRWEDAVRELPPGLPARCASGICPQIPRASAYDGAGKRDSAVMLYEQMVRPLGTAFLEMPLVYRRLGELYAEKNETAKAIDWYQKFVDAWKDAEPRLQPQVDDVRRRIARLKEQERRSR